jgi:hypothetical protein
MHVGSKLSIKPTKCLARCVREVESVRCLEFRDKAVTVTQWDVGLETWSRSRDLSRPLFGGLGLGLLVLVSDMSVLVSVSVSILAV